MSDQPPEVDEAAEPGRPGSLPPVTAAAERVIAFLREFGDGLVLGGGEGDLPHLPPLYARDLEALTRMGERTREQWRLRDMPIEPGSKRFDTVPYPAREWAERTQARRGGTLQHRLAADTEWKDVNDA